MSTVETFELPVAGTTDGDWLRERFWEKVIRGGPNECWAWDASRDDNDYGRFGVGGRPHSAHRVSWVLEHGPLALRANGRRVFVLQECDHPWCVNPAHLFLGNAKANADDAAAKGRLPGPRVLGAGVEAKILELHAEGRTNREIAEGAGVCLSTVVRRVGRPRAKPREKAPRAFMGF